MIRTVWHIFLSLMVFASALVILPARVNAAPTTETAESAEEVQANYAKAEKTIEALDAPLYSAFTERYLLDEVKVLRQMLADHRVEVTEKMTDRELGVA
ncbi:MAG: hypothetical protein VX245_04835, partial [Pseudomonadota bacterium]|nr:hypothetical protein [Pseudomonadota bacterium]